MSYAGLGGSNKDGTKMTVGSRILVVTALNPPLSTNRPSSRHQPSRPQSGDTWTALGVQDANTLIQPALQCVVSSNDKEALDRGMAFESHRKATTERNMTTTVQVRSDRARLGVPRTANTSSTITSPAPIRTAQWDEVRTAKPASSDDVTTPVKAFLSTNITPRSGSRKARVDTAASSPLGTPLDTPTATGPRSRPSSVLSPSDRQSQSSQSNSGLGIRGTDQGYNQGYSSRSGSTISNSHVSSLSAKGPTTLITKSRWTASPEPTPKFFHASDASNHVGNLSTPPSQTVTGKPKSSGFVYANGEREALRVSPPQTVAPKEAPQNKFFHADGATALDSEPLSPTGRLFSPPLGSTPRIPPKHIGPQRPTSPLKESALTVGSHHGQRSRTNSAASSITEETSRSSKHYIPKPHATSSSLRSSMSSPAGHAKSKSISSLDTTNKRAGPTLFLLDTNTRKHDHTAQLLATPAPVSEEFLPPNSPELRSPIKPTFPSETNISHLDDLAANARRERKVLDLEISNSSLLAINRTLEREMRKQAHELRRFRRLIQAGRISLARSHRTVSNNLSTATLSAAGDTTTGFGSSDDEDDRTLDLQPHDSDSDSSLLSSPSPSPSSVDDSLLSPSTQLTEEAKRRARDEKRLQLDLSKHQELLLDSQRMNQSLKRCLGWTEQLISEGKKALAYQVRVSEVAMPRGGRVLSPEEVEIEVDRGRGLLSPGSGEKVRNGISGEGEDKTMDLLDVEISEDEEDYSRDSLAFSEVNIPVLRDESLQGYGQDVET
ncbi:hypothetical protein MMC25_006417 [Agyrium rufum]|nr:hypothetical protein [Agyrium rufum]